MDDEEALRRRRRLLFVTVSAQQKPHAYCICEKWMAVGVTHSVKDAASASRCELNDVSTSFSALAKKPSAFSFRFFPRAPSCGRVC